eukprot:351849-Chlamydomonas_euryale.AAC.7
MKMRRQMGMHAHARMDGWREGGREGRTGAHCEALPHSLNLMRLCLRRCFAFGATRCPSIMCKSMRHACKTGRMGGARVHGWDGRMHTQMRVWMDKLMDGWAS